MKTVFIKDDEVLFRKLWDEYVEKNPSTIRYSSTMLEYNKAYSPLRHDDMSFVVLQDLNPVGVCYLPLEKGSQGLTFSMNESFSPAPLAVDRKTEKFIFSVIRDLAEKLQVVALKFLIDPLLPSYQSTYNFLCDYGFLDSSTTGGIIDLKENTWELMRKGHRLSIKEIKKNPEYSLEVMDYTNANFKIHEIYRELHRLCAGRVTRSLATFERQYEMLKKDQSVLVGLKHKEKYVGFSNFVHSKKTALYFSAADDPVYMDVNRIPIYHSTVWTGVEYYKARGFEKIDLSLPFAVSTQFSEKVDTKTKNIANFKRGFGGPKVPFFRGTLYRSKDVFNLEYSQFKKNYEEYFLNKTDALLED